MTPPTTAARSAHRSASSSRGGAGRHPRRISGPAASGRLTAAAVAIPSPGIALPRRRPARKTGRKGQGAPGIALRAVDAFDGISSNAVLDRLIRGRVWIGLLAFALIGIVAMQLLVLEFNTGIGRTLGHIAQLQRQNAQLGIEDSTYSAESRVAPLAAAAGMTLAPAGTVHFVAASKADVTRAATALSTAVQSTASGVSESTEAGGVETGPASTGGGEVSAAGASGSGQGSASTAEAGGSGEDVTSSEGGAASSESSPAAGSGQGSSAPVPSPPAATAPSTTAASSAGAQATGASAAPSSGTPGVEVGGSAEGAPAGSRE